MALIGIDIGTSFIKGAVLDIDGARLQSIQRIPFPPALPGLPPLYSQYDPRAVLSAVRGLLSRLVTAAGGCEGLVMCGQMHSLVLVARDGEPLSPIFSWQDQRVLMPHPSGKGTYFDVLSGRISPEEQRVLGNELRPGLPIGQLFWLAEQGQIPGGQVYPASLPDFILANLAGAPPVTEVTHAMAHGAFNLETLAWHTDVLERLGLSGLCWPEVVQHGAVVGRLAIGERAIPCYTPVGDYQCALLGALLRERELSLNISTGSQVSLLKPGLEFGDYQTRPFFDGRFLACVTHIPAGRSLNSLVRLLTELPAAQQGEPADPWPYILQAAARVQEARLRVDLAFFNSACGDHGQITDMREEELTVGHLFRAAFQAMADNYYACALRLSPERDWDRLVFSGGLAQKIPLLREMICDKFQAGPAGPTPNPPCGRLGPTAEDTLLGLLALALAFSGRTPNLDSAAGLLSETFSEA